MKRRYKYKEQDKGQDEDDISIYSKEVRELMLEDDELSPMEEAFMEGYENAA